MKPCVRQSALIQTVQQAWIGLGLQTIDLCCAYVFGQVLSVSVAAAPYQAASLHTTDRALHDMRHTQMRLALYYQDK